MAFYLVRAKVAHDFMKALVERPEDRLVTTTRLLQGIGGRLHYYFFCFGEYDIVLIDGKIVLRDGEFPHVSDVDQVVREATDRGRAIANAAGVLGASELQWPAPVAS